MYRKKILLPCNADLVDQNLVARFRERIGTAFLWAIALAALSYSFYLAVTFVSQPLLDDNDFRQTQTALTSYWFIQQGFQLAYETPVGGRPWALPLEFPIYQAIVAYVAKTFNLDLNSTGRMVSYAFLLLSIIPVIGITKRLKLPGAVSLYFIAILFSMPIYVHYGRTFMVETAALFFCIAAIKFFIDYLLGERTAWVYIGFIVFASLGVLQKATTALPVLAVLSAVFLVFELKRFGLAQSRSALIKNIACAGLLFLIPVAIGFAWTNFATRVAMENQLASMVLRKEWYFGSVSQRVSSSLWVVVIWERILRDNLGATLGTFLLTIPFLVNAKSKTRFIMLCAVSLGVAPLFLFTNVHVVHQYYQVANLVFFAYAVSLSFAVLEKSAFGRRAAIFTLIIIMLSNYVVLHNAYLPMIKNKFTKENSIDLAVGKILNREIPYGGQLVAFHHSGDWNSALAYISERKSLTVPRWHEKYDQVVSNPAEFLDEGRLGAVVSCTTLRTQKPSIIRMFDWAKMNGSWKAGEVHGCIIFTPETTFVLDAQPLSDSDQCQGSIDAAVVDVREGKEFILFAGWLVEGGDNKRVPDDIVLRVSNKDIPPFYLQTLKVPRLDVNTPFGIHSDIDTGFSRVVENRFEPGVYDIELAGRFGNEFKSCGIHKALEIR